jgi:AAA+ ATPase superfamily predicted ATPase
MKQEFYYDVLIDEEDYCNRIEDIKKIDKLVQSGRKIVLYAPRRYGKSSLVKNIVGRHFQNKKNHMTLYVNLMEVQSLYHISERILQSLKEVLKFKYPLKSSFNSIVESFKGLTISLSTDPSTQLPSFELKPLFENDKKNISQIFSVIQNLSKQYKIFIIFDEFQDISNVEQAAGILRNEIQTLKALPIAMLGSKKELLNKIFSSNKSPFFGFGDEISLSFISHLDWQFYFNERLFPYSISMEAMEYICTTLQNVPNAICEIGASLRESKRILNKKKLFEITDVAEIMQSLILAKESTYRFQEGLFSTKEQLLMRAIAKRGYLLKPTEQSVVHETKTSSGSLIKIIQRLTQKGWIEYEETKGYRISDPLFSLFFKIKY